MQLKSKYGVALNPLLQICRELATNPSSRLFVSSRMGEFFLTFAERKKILREYFFKLFSLVGTFKSRFVSRRAALRINGVLMLLLKYLKYRSLKLHVSSTMVG